MNNHRKIFSEGLNADDDFSAIGKGQWVNAENIRTFTTDSGATGRIENVWGTKVLFNDMPGGLNRCIGGCEDESKNTILWFNWNSLGNHGVYCYDKLLGQGFKVLMSADVIGGLNFSRYAYIHSCFIANGNLYWTNGTQNQPRRINIEAGIKAYDNTFVTKQKPYNLPLSQSVISWIRKPGALPPIAIKVVQTSPAIDFNYVKNAAVQFCYRYNFRDYEFSTLSALSYLCDYNSKDDTFNRIDISIPAEEKIEQDVISIDMVVRNVVDNSYFIIKTWDSITDAAEIAAHNSGIALSFAFYNGKTGEALGDAYKVKPFDSFPIYAETCELAKNRSYVANYIEGYNTPKVTSLSTTLTYETIGTTSVDTVIGKWYKLHFRLVENKPPSLAKNYDKYVMATTTPLDAVLPSAPIYYWIATGTIPPYPGTLNYTDLTFVGNTISQLSDYFRSLDGYNPGNSTVYDKTLTDTLGRTVVSTSGSSTTVAGKAFKSNSSYELGVTFYDQFQRKCGIRKMTNPLYITQVILAGALHSFSTTGLNDLYVVSIDTTNIHTGDVIQLIDNSYGIQGDYTILSKTDSGGNSSFVLDRNTGAVASGTVYLTVLRNIKTDNVISTPDAKLDNNFVTALNWSLDNLNALDEIPDWAWYYSIDITKCLSTRIFMDGAGMATYADRNETTGLFDLKTTFTDSAFLLIESAGLQAFGMGYTFTEGDIIKIVSGSTEYITAITGTEGKYIMVQPVNLGDLSPSLVTFEIITPYKPSETEPFYETGEMFAISNPATTSRKYGTISGSIGGDVYLLQRTYSTAIFVAEAMSPNDKYWKIWNTNTGRPNIVETIGQVNKGGGRRFSNTFIQGSKTNGLSSYEALNEDILDIENGAIKKLQLANKVQLDGTVMLNICENENVSTYLGEQEMFDTQGSAFIAKANSVLGSSKALKGSNGTRNPESVFEHNGLVFYYDARNAVWVQYSVNGLFPISKKKFTRPANLFSKKYSSLTDDEIIALGSEPNVIGGFDPYHKEALFTIPSTETPPKGYLEDYPTVAYPYDIYDGKGKTLMYKSDADVWFGGMSFETEKFIKMGNDLYSFKDGCLYIHNQVGSTTFYGVPFKAKLMYSNNPGAIHTFLSIGLESNKKPDFVHFRTEDPYVQSSDLITSDFAVKEGVISASLLRDRLSPNTSGDYNKKQVTGDKLFGKALLVMLEYEFENDTTPLQLRVSNVGNNVRQGSFINQQ